MHVPSLAQSGTCGIMASEKMNKNADNRRSNKPIMEKRRRARINSCLNDLKTLILEAMKKDPSRHSKLEKADILEMTVKYLQNLQRQQVALTLATDPQVINKYRAGFGECANEVSRYVSRMDNVDPNIRTRLLNHLSTCLNSITPSRTPTTSNKTASPIASPVHIQIPTGQVSLMPPVGCDVVSGIQLVPSRLANGELAFLLPTSSSTSGSHIMYTTRATSPTHTVSSSTSTLSPVGSDFSDISSPTPSPLVGPCGPHVVPLPPAESPQNLSLSKKSNADDGDSMWRPW